MKITMFLNWKKIENSNIENKIKVSLVVTKKLFSLMTHNCLGNELVACVAL